jgi:hypothetical protein
MPRYIRHKPYNYLAWRLRLYLNGPKWPSTRPTSPRSSIGCAQHEYQAYYCMFTAKPCNYLAWRWHYLQMDQNELPFDPHHLGAPSSVAKRICCPWYNWCKPCSYLTPRLTLSPSRPKRDSTWPMSPRNSIGCARNDFQAYCTFGANCVPILCGVYIISKRT